MNNQQTGECDRSDCFCHEAQRLSSFDAVWNSLPLAYRRVTEREIAEYIDTRAYLRGYQDGKAEAIAAFNADLCELQRLASERL